MTGFCGLLLVNNRRNGEVFIGLSEIIRGIWRYNKFYVLKVGSQNLPKLRLILRIKKLNFSEASKKKTEFRKILITRGSSLFYIFAF